MKKNFFYSLVAMLLVLSLQTVMAQERRPIDNQHPLWLVHIDVWNSADPQKIIDLIPNDIKPYVCMNLSLSCQFDEKTKMYRMPRYAVRTYKSWASVCQANGLWFSCQPASGGHTHIQDDDLETFEYFFKTYPNFLGWNFAEQFWGFNVAGNESSSTEVNRWALFAKLVEMSHNYGGFLTISWCGGVYHMNTNPIAELKRNKDFLAACRKYPEAILFLYKYTHAGCFYNNESVCWGPFVSGLTKNYGVRYDNCGWNDTLNKLLGDNHGKKYPGSAGIGTVMEQTCVNGGAVWDGPELIWTEDFQNLSNSTVEGYTRRNWGTFANFKGIWLDMFRQIINGTMYIPSREEVVNKTKIVVINDKADDYTTWDDLYNGLYLQTDPFNQKKEGAWNYGQWYNNLCYFKKTGRYGAIPMVTALYDDLAKSIPVQVKKSNYASRWSTQTKKVSDFNAQYPEVSTGDLYVNRYRNQLVTYTPYTYLNAKKRASAVVPLQYNTCEALKLDYSKLSNGIIREYADHIDFYLNNYRSDSTTAQTDTIFVTGVEAEPSYELTKHTTSATGQLATVTAAYDAEAKIYQLNVRHMGPLTLRVNCTGAAERTATDLLPAETLPIPKQPDDFKGNIIIEAENMDYKSVKNVALTHSGWWAQDMTDFAGMGYVETGTNTAAALRHQLSLKEGGQYDILVRYCASSKAGNLSLTVNGIKQSLPVEKVDKNDWQKAKLTATLNAGKNNLVIATNGINMIIDQIIYSPVGTPVEKFLVTVRPNESGTVVPDVEEAAEGDIVTLKVQAKPGFQLKELRVVNSVYYTMAKTIALGDDPETITFVMPDDNVTLQPVFADLTSVYKLDYVDVLNGAMPEGWRCIMANNETHEYPNTFGSGARTFVGFSGYQGKALYWRDNCAEYGRQTAYRLALEPGHYKLTYAMAAWKGSPQYKLQLLNLSTGKAVATTQTFTASPNANGNSSASVASATKRELDFTIETKGNYVIRFSDETSAGGMHEFLLLECRINTAADPNGIEGVVLTNGAGESKSIVYDLRGVRQQELRRGINIIRTADGKTRKVIKR